MLDTCKGVRELNRGRGLQPPKIPPVCILFSMSGHRRVREIAHEKLRFSIKYTGLCIKCLANFAYFVYFRVYGR